MPAAWVRKQLHLDVRSWQVRSDSPILRRGEQKKSKSEKPKTSTCAALAIMYGAWWLT